VTKNSGVRRVEPAGYEARWIWPPVHISNRCRVTVSAARPSPHAAPDDLPPLSDSVVERCSDNSTLPTVILTLPPEAAGAYVLVWAMIQVDTETFYSAPLELGQIPAGA